MSPLKIFLKELALIAFFISALCFFVLRLDAWNRTISIAFATSTTLMIALVMKRFYEAKDLESV